MKNFEAMGLKKGDIMEILKKNELRKTQVMEELKKLH